MPSCAWWSPVPVQWCLAELSDFEIIQGQGAVLGVLIIFSDNSSLFLFLWLYVVFDLLNSTRCETHVSFLLCITHWCFCSRLIRLVLARLFDKIVQAIVVALSLASALASNFWLNFFISVNNSKSFYTIDFKLHTLINCHKVTLYIKFHNSWLNIYEIMQLFDLEFSVKLFYKC